MAKGKATRRTDKPEKPAAAAPTTGDLDASKLRVESVWKDFLVTLLLLLAVAATVVIWVIEPASAQRGLMQTGVVWTVSLVGLFGRLQARRRTCQLEAILAHNEIVSA